MKKRFKKSVIIFLIIFIILIVGTILIYKYIQDFKEDKRLTAEKAKEVTTYYSKFNESINEFANQRENLYKLKEETYLEDFAKNYEGWNTLITNYEKVIQSVEDSGKKLKENCQYRFSDLTANSNCTTFIANYEAAMNYYITDVKNYNKTVKEYNTWVTEGNYNYGKLNKAKLVVYKKYIDYDKDGEYFGKEETK